MRPLAIGAALLALGLAGACLTAIAAAAPLTVVVRPEAFAFAGGDIEIRIHVEPSDDRRVLVLEIDSVDLYRSSRDQLEPGDSPTRPSFWLRNPPAGVYLVAVGLFEPSGKLIARATATTRILEGVRRR